jgi:hypothetical protein
MWWFGVGACEYIQFIFIGMSLLSDWDSSEGTVTGRGGGHLRNLASIPCKDNSFISLPKVLNPLWRPPGLLVSNEGFCLVVKGRDVRLVTYLRLVLRLRISAATHTFPPNVSFGCAQGQIYTVSAHKLIN